MLLVSWFLFYKGKIKVNSCFNQLTKPIEAKVDRFSFKRL